MSKPSAKLNWTPGASPTDVIQPSTAKKTTGWAAKEKPPYEYMNWINYNLSQWIHFLSAVSHYSVVIDSDSDEADYASIQAYIADTPASGDRVFIKNDQTVTAQITIPAGIEITMEKGSKFTCAANLTQVIEFGGDNIKVIGELIIELSHTGTVVEVVTYNGDNNHHDNIEIRNTSTGTVTNAFLIRAGKKGNYARGVTENTGGGTITNILTDSSAEDSNDLVIRET